MADNSTGLAVKSLSAETVRSRLVDTGGTNEAAISAAGRLSVDASGVAIQLAAGAANIGDVDVLTVPAPLSTTGNGTAATALRVTMASDSTGTVALTGSLPAGTNNIGDVDVASIIPGVTATSLGKAEDTAHTTGDTGVMVLAVRNDGGSVLADATGDYVPFTTDATGALRVTGGSAGTQYVGDAAATATPTGTMSMGLANAAAPADVSANADAVAQWMLRNGSAVVNLASGGTLVTIGAKTSANSLPVVLASDQAALPITDNAGSLTIDAPVGTPAFVRLSDGTAAMVGSKTSANSLPVVIASDQGAFAVTVSSTAVAGTTAHDAVGTSVNPVAVGLYSSAAAPTGVSLDGDIVRAWALANGSQVVNIAAGGTLWTNMGQTAASGQFARVTDGTTTAGVIVGTTALKTDLSSIAGTAPGATSFVPARLTDGAAYYTRYGQAVATAQFASITDGTLTATVRDTGTSDSLNVSVVDGSGNQITSFGGGTQYVGDAAATATPTGAMAMGLANAAAPADVSANNDAVAQWMLRNGSAVVNLASGGTLITVGSKVSASSLPVVIASDQAAVASNITQIGGATQSATNPLSIRPTNGTSFLANLGETAATGNFVRLTDATNTAAVIATINALKTDFSSVAGAVPSATNPVPVRLTDGAAFYASASGAPATPTVSTVTSGSLGAGATVDLDHTQLTAGQTGHLMGVDVASTVPLKVEIKTVDGSNVATTRVVLFAPTYSGIQWRSPYKTFITRAGAAASARFRVTVTNKDNNTAADVYSTAYFDIV